MKEIRPVWANGRWWVKNGWYGIVDLGQLQGEKGRNLGEAGLVGDTYGVSEVAVEGDVTQSDGMDEFVGGRDSDGVEELAALVEVELGGSGNSGGEVDESGSVGNRIEGRGGKIGTGFGGVSFEFGIGDSPVYGGSSAGNGNENKDGQ